jgi:hypothetical protein
MPVAIAQSTSVVPVLHRSPTKRQELALLAAGSRLRTLESQS